MYSYIYMHRYVNELKVLICTSVNFLLHVYVLVYVGRYIYVYMCTKILCINFFMYDECSHTQVYIRACMMYFCIYIHVHVHLHIYEYNVYIYICVYVYMYIYAYI